MVLIHVHVAPPLAERYKPLSRRCGLAPRTLSASTMAYTMSGLLGAIARLMRPLVVVGKPPPVISFHVVPPSVDFQSADPGPPLLRKCALRMRSQLVA